MFTVIFAIELRYYNVLYDDDETEMGQRCYITSVATNGFMAYFDYMISIVDKIDLSDTDLSSD